MLFANQGAFQPDRLKGFAAEIGLDGEDFAACLDSGKFREDVRKDFEEGNDLGVSGTPAFFVNGRFVSGAQPFEAFQAIIDEELSRAG